MHSNIRALLLYLLSGASLATAQPAPTQTHQITLAAREPTTTAAPVGWFTTTKNIATIGGETDEHFTLPAKTIQIVIPTCIQTHEPDENGHLPPGTCNAHWDYYPSFSAAAAFAVLFAALTAVHVWQAAKYKKVRMLHLRVIVMGELIFYSHGAGLLSWRAFGRRRLSRSER